MPMPAEDIIAYIKQAMPDADVTIKDLAGDNNHYSAVVISSTFKGLSMVKQHQMVYASLQGHMGTTLHALALETKTPDA